MYCEPEYSPWGEIQRCETLAPGIFLSRPLATAAYWYRIPLPGHYLTRLANVAFGTVSTSAMRRTVKPVLSCGNCWTRTGRMFRAGSKTQRPLSGTLTEAFKGTIPAIGKPAGRAA